MVDDCKSRKFVSTLSSPIVDIVKLRDLLWAGCPTSMYSFRSMSWKLMLGYLPLRSDKRGESYERKFREYEELSSSFERTAMECPSALTKQIEIDIPRTCNYGIDALNSPSIQEVIRKVLMVWSARNLACGYVQGINDLATPLLIVLLEEYRNRDVREIRVRDLANTQLRKIDCDLFWMLSKLLQDLPENYTPSQPGIQRQNILLREILNRVDPELLKHMLKENVDTIQLSFRWFNCLMVREFTEAEILRIWDTLIAEGQNGLSTFLVYLAAAVVLKHSIDIKRMDFQEIHSFFGNEFCQNHRMNLKDVEALLSEAYVLQCLFQASPKHLRSS